MNYLIGIIEHHQTSLYVTWAKYVLAKVYNGYQMKVRRTFQCTPEEISHITKMKLSRYIVHLQNGTYYTLYNETYATYADLKTQTLEKLQIPECFHRNLGFLEVVEKKHTYEERYLEDFNSAAETLGFWRLYKKSRTDISDIKLYFTFRIPLKMGETGPLIPLQYMQFCNDFKRGKHEASNSEIIECIAAMMQGDLGDCSIKTGQVETKVHTYVPVNRTAEGDKYWSKKVFIKNFELKKGS